MEFQDFVNQTDNYLQVCKELHLNVIKYKQLALIKTYKNNDYDYELYPWMRYCRGIVIDTETNKVICVPPKKSMEIKELTECYFPEHTDTEYSVLLDGTMINMFYYQGNWILTTRSSIGARTKWDGQRSFANLFKESEPPSTWRDGLKKDHCYSFVLVHKQNRIVSPVNENGIFLVEQHKLGDTIEKVELDMLVGVQNVITFNSNYLENYQRNLYFSIKGFTMYKDGIRYKWMNPNYVYVSGLKANHNNKLMNYITLRQNGNLKEYLQYFPEESHLFNNYRDDYNSMKDDIFNGYLSRFVYKNKTMEQIPYPLRPVLYELHQKYLHTNEKTTMKIVSEYFHQMDGKRIAFMYNYLFT
jgi:hypothetical protein